nr:cobalt ECF transporter T component CbiQ [uncultured Aminipila sp.]
MSKINEAVHGIHYMDDISAKDKWINQIHPLAKLIVTISYILAVVSFDKYDVAGLAGMSIYLLSIIILGDVPIVHSIKQIKIVLILACIVGIANPFIDKTQMWQVGKIVITGGMLSMISLMLKGIFAVVASYVLIATTSIEKICYSLRLIRAPKELVTLILLIYRYVIVLLKEVERISDAYQLRAPNQKGIHIKAWGSLAGQLLLRSIDRAQVVYESMTLRGYNGEFSAGQEKESTIKSICYCILWMGLILIFRVIPLFKIVGNILV